jgi:hypothetical protein
MPAEALFEGLVRLFGELFVEVFFEIACYCLGFGALRLLSLGNYPPAAPSRRQELVWCFVGRVRGRVFAPVGRASRWPLAGTASIRPTPMSVDTL